jgi:hypothetical protein
MKPKKGITANDEWNKKRRAEGLIESSQMNGEAQQRQMESKGL